MIIDSAARARLLAPGNGVAIGALPTVTEWDQWWKAWAPDIAAQVGKEGWILFVLDAIEKMAELEVTLSRILRSKPSWNTALWSEQEWLNVEDTAGYALAWYDRNCPKLDQVPEWCAFVLCAMRGHFTVLARLGQELRAAQTQGYTTVVVENRTDSLGQNILAGGDKFLAEVI